jgi:hypothetical protein
LDILDKLKNSKLPPTIYIGGSLPLIVYGVIPYRIPKDIDLISCIPIKECGLDAKKGFNSYKFKKDGINFEIFYNPKAEYIEYNYKEHIFKFSPIEEIMDFKLELSNREITCTKHLEDIKCYREYITQRL